MHSSHRQAKQCVFLIGVYVIKVKRQCPNMGGVDLFAPEGIAKHFLEAAELVAESLGQVGESISATRTQKPKPIIKSVFCGYRSQKPFYAVLVQEKSGSPRFHVYAAIIMSSSSVNFSTSMRKVR